MTIARLLSAAAMILGLIAAPAGAASSHAKHGDKGGAHVRRTHVTILTPKQGAQPSGPSVTAEVKVDGGHFRAYLNGREVTSHFHGKGVRTATFRRGSILKTGEANLLVTAGRDQTASTDSSRFLVRRHDEKLLTLSVSRKGSFVAPRVDLRTTGPVRRTKLWLNGRRIADDGFDPYPSQEGLNGRIQATRLQFGTNQLKVMVLQQDGLFARRELRFKVPRDEPIASAGSDRRVGIGGRAKLTASASRPPLLTLIPVPKAKAKTRARAATASSTAVSPPSATGEKSLEYEWKILEAPEGSEAKILEPTEEEVELIPDLPGEYLAAVTVTAPDGTQSVDDVSIESPVAPGPMGMPIQTITAPGGIQIGAPGQLGTKEYARRGSWVQMLVLNPKTAGPEPGPWDGRSGVPEAAGGGGILAFDPGQGKQLLEAVEATNQQLVILSGQGLSVQMQGSDAESLAKAIEYLGGTVAAGGTTPNGASNLAAGTWSLIGHKGLPVGGADQNAFHTEEGISGFLAGATGQAGSLNGYLQSGLNAPGFQYISPEVVPIDTKWTPNLSTPPSPFENTIKVGDSMYGSGPINTAGVGGCPCAVAIQLLALEQGTLKATLAGTFGIISTTGATDVEGVNALDYSLHKLIGEHEAGASSLIVMQDFGGSDAPSWPGGEAVQWVEDMLPPDNWSPGWAGNTYPDKPSQLAYSWNQSYAYGSVAGNLGILVSPGFHDVVANYRRPIFNPVTGRVENRNWGGLTAIASTNLFDKSSAFGAGQGTIPPKGNNPLVNNGRITGALVRDNQGQWKVTGQAAGAGYPNLVDGVEANSNVNEFDSTSLPEVVLAPQTEWPCSTEHPEPCSKNPTEVREAMKYIAAHTILLGGYENVRAAYLKNTIDWNSALSEIEKHGRAPCAGQAAFDANTCETLRGELESEFGEVGQVDAGFDDLTNLFEGDLPQLKANVSSAMNEVTASVAKAKKNLLREEAEYKASSWISDALFVGSNLLSGVLATQPEADVPLSLKFGPGGISALGYLVQLGQSLSPYWAEQNAGVPMPDNTEVIRDKAERLSGDLEASLTAAAANLKHFEDIVRTDPVKLETAAKNFSLKWSMESTNEERFERSLTLGAVKSLYDTVMPLAFDQWMIGPRFTNTNPGGPQEMPGRGYNCTYVNGDEEVGGFDRPLENAPKSMSAMNSVAWGAAPRGPEGTFTIRVLKQKVNNIQLERAASGSSEEGNVLMRHRGESAHASLTDKLFEEPSELTPSDAPKGLGLNKEEFFGLEGWNIRLLQCGHAQ